MSTRTVAEELAARIRADGAGPVAVTDVRAAAGNLPCVLIPPPSILPGAYGGPLLTWRLILLAASATGSAQAWDQLDALLDKVFDAVPFELAEPGSYALPTGGDPLPCYIVTYSGA